MRILIQVLINAMQLSHPEMVWVVDDIRSLSSLDSESYDVVIEKATVEALLVNEKVRNSEVIVI